MAALEEFIPLSKNNEPTKDNPIVVDVRGVINRKRKASEDLTNNYKKEFILPDTQHNYLPNNFKTRICDYWKEGKCRNSKEKCNFAHGIDDLNFKNQHIKSYNYMENREKKEQELKRSDEEIDKYNLKRKEEELNTKENELETREEALKTKENELETREEALKTREECLKTREEGLKTKELDIESKKQYFIMKETDLKTRETDLKKREVKDISINEENYKKRIKYLEEVLKLKKKEIELKEEQLKHYIN